MDRMNEKAGHFHTQESKTSSSDQKHKGKKMFVKPKLKRHESLPEVTTSYVGTFDPNKEYPSLP